MPKLTRYNFLYAGRLVEVYPDTPRELLRDILDQETGGEMSAGQLERLCDYVQKRQPQKMDGENDERSAE